MSFEATNAAAAPARLPALRRSALVSFVVDAVGYGLASAVALAVDYGLLVALVRLAGMHYLAAAACAFGAGLTVAYTLSTFFVFRGRARYGAGAEFIGFLVTGLAGLALNQILLFAFVDGLHVAVELAKAPTAGLVFCFNFLSRRFLLFRARA
ncbi:MAG: GtrA family protein [Beijerinckiaceae bacterium]